MAALALVAGLTTPVPGAAVVPAGFSEVVVLGSESVHIDQDVLVTSGDAVANQVDPSPEPPPPGLVELFFDKRATTVGSLRADSVSLGKDATVGGDVAFNEPPDSTFVGWGGDCTGTGFSTTVTMDADKKCSAEFQ